VNDLLALRRRVAEVRQASESISLAVGVVSNVAAHGRMLLEPRVMKRVTLMAERAVSILDDLAEELGNAVDPRELVESRRDTGKRRRRPS
jgi:hypothetical protein